MTGILGKIFSSASNALVGTVGTIIDDVVTSREEREKLKEALFKTISDAILALYQLQSDIVKTEMTGNWLQRSWRPMIMLMFGWIILYYYFISPVFSTPGIDLPDKFWELLKIGLGGYIVGRSAEKIVSSVNVKELLKKS